MNNFLHRLIEVLKILGSDPVSQRVYLEKLGTSPSADELVLEFDDVYLAFESNLDSLKGDVDKKFLSKVDSLNKLFDEMSNNRPELWTVYSLASDEWSKVRRIANEALSIHTRADEKT